MKPVKQQPVRLSAPDNGSKNLKDIPQGMYQANRYDTDNERVLTIYSDGKTYDIREPKPISRDVMF